MREALIEARLKEAVKQSGGRCLKWSSPSQRGVPDRICVMPGGRIVFVELKAPGKKPTPLQAHLHDRLRELGADVRVIDSVEAADAFA